jgi:hypothetical protein
VATTRATHSALGVVAVGLAAFLSGWALLAWAAHGPERVLVVNATFSSNACCTMQIWLNGATRQDDAIVLPIQPGVEADYEFPMEKTRITRLRLKLGDKAGSSVVLHRIYVRRGSRTVSALAPGRLRQFTPYSATKDPARGPAAYRVQVHDAMLDQDKLNLKTGAGPVQVLLARVVDDPGGSIPGLIILGTLAILVAGVTRRAWVGALAAGAGLASVYALPALFGHVHLLNDVSQAVSNCAFIGVSKPTQRYMVIAAAVLAAAVPAAVTGLGRLLRQEVGDQEANPQEETRDGWGSWWVGLASTLLPVLIIACLFAPSLKSQLTAATSVQWPDSFDQNNFLVWDYLVDRGLLPMKDFYYPYGVQYLTTTDLPWGSVIRFAIAMLWWSYAVIGSWALVGRFFTGRGRVIRHAVLMAFLVTFALGGFDLGTRYMAPLGIVLLFCSLRPDDSLTDWKRILVAVGLMQVALYEVAQALYALGPIAFLVAFGVFENVRRPLSGTVRVLAKSVATVVVPLLAAALVLVLTGQLGGVWLVYGHLSAVTATYAYPIDLNGWIRQIDNISSFDFWAFPVTLAVGSYGLVAYRDRRRTIHACVLALGLLGFMIIEREVVRDGAQRLMWISATYGLLFWAVAGATRTQVRRAGGVAVLLGVIAAVTTVSHGYSTGWNQLKGGPARLASDVSELFGDRSAYAAATKSRWAPQRFAGYKEWPVARALTGTTGRTPRFWVLGDASAIILLTHDRWPYYFTDFYDGGNIFYQKKLLGQLRTRKPGLVAFDFAPTDMVFDGVPDVVRVPLIYTWAVRNYVPHRLLQGDWAILKPRRGNETIPLDWWRRRIGATLDLGRVPEAAHLGRDLCIRGPRCRSYIVVVPTPGAPQPGSFVIPVTVDGLSFRVQFETDPRARRYVVDLSRVWFWAVASSDARRSVSTDAVPGATVTVTKRLQDPDVLY